MTLDEAIKLTKYATLERDGYNSYAFAQASIAFATLLDFAEEHKDCEYCNICIGEAENPKPKIEELTLDWRIDPENETQMSKLVEYCLKLQNKVNELVRRVNG